MKTITIFALLCLALSQNPIPAPSFDLTKLSGQWNVVWTYNEDWYSEMTYSDCSMWQIKIDGTSGSGNIDYEGAGWGIGFGFAAQTPNTVWDVELAGNVTWIAYDPNFNWFTGVKTTPGFLNNAFILSKTANLSNLIINTQILLVKAEGFGVNATNQHFYNNTNNASCMG